MGENIKLKEMIGSKRCRYWRRLRRWQGRPLEFGCVTDGMSEVGRMIVWFDTRFNCREMDRSRDWWKSCQRIKKTAG
jgi:hypothetical protein